MKVLLVNGSPHKNGCTNRALEEISKTLSEEGIESEIYHIGNKPIGSCMGCRSCSKLGRCVIEDGVNEFLDYAKDFDGFIFGTAVHYASATGGITSFLDRAFYVNMASGKKIFEHKPGSAVASARRAGTTATLDQINKYFSISQMPIISGRYWNMVHGFTPEDVAKDEEGLQNMRFLARNMVWHLKCQKAASDAGIYPPEQEPVTPTHFIKD